MPFPADFAGPSGNGPLVAILYANICTDENRYEAIAGKTPNSGVQKVWPGKSDRELFSDAENIADDGE